MTAAEILAIPEIAAQIRLRDAEMTETERFVGVNAYEFLYYRAKEWREAVSFRVQLAAKLPPEQQSRMIERMKNSANCTL